MYSSYRWLIAAALLGFGFLWFQPILARQNASAPSKVTHAKAKPSVQIAAPKQAQKDEQDCDTGCASHGKLKSPARAQWMQTLRQFSNEPLQSGSPALETLLFHGSLSRKHLAALSQVPLPSKHEAFLRKELRQTHAWVSVRIRTGRKSIAAWTKPEKVEIGHHFHLVASRTHKIQIPAFGGRVERVGLNHLWVRI